MKYFSEGFEFEVGLDATVVATETADGATCDLQGYQGVTALIDVGLWTDGAITIHFEELHRLNKLPQLFEAVISRVEVGRLIGNVLPYSAQVSNTALIG